MFIPENSPNEILRIVSKLKNKLYWFRLNFGCCSKKLVHLPLIQSINSHLQSSLCTGILQIFSKTAKIKPLLKKGTKNDIQNYRPISLLSVSLKNIRKAFLLRMETFLRKTAFSDSQHGFRKSKSKETVHFLFQRCCFINRTK